MKNTTNEKIVPELLAPAGNMECLRTAAYFGADAVYVAGKSYGLRAFADNFGYDELAEAVSFLHGMGKKLYVTVNVLMRNADLPGLPEHLEKLHEIGVDAVIVSDPAAVVFAKQAGIEVHLSTQASTSNSVSARFWYEQGVKRVVLARELSLKEIKQIRDECPEEMEIEAFVHGAMCIAYSGRCLLSSVLTGRSGNKGACAQPCRWKYTIHESGYPDDYFPIAEDERGTYILNSRDLMMIDHIPELIDSGIISFKIEGRMKSAFYVASVVSAYRKAIDAYLAGERADASLAEDLRLSGTRSFTTGFYYGNPRADGQDTEKTLGGRKYTFCALALEGDAPDGMIYIEQRNKFNVGEELSVLSPNMPSKTFKVTDIVNMDGELQAAAPHPQQKLYINCPFELQAGDMLRRLDD